MFFYLKVSFDLSLARGLDYYTGVIYEAVLTDLSEDIIKKMKMADKDKSNVFLPTRKKKSAVKNDISIN